MRMTHRDRQRIGGIGGDTPIDPQQHLDHVRHLPLLRRSRPDQGEFDRAGRVLEHRQSFRHGAKRGATCLTQL